MKKVRLAVAGVGNNISALSQGIAYYATFEACDPLPGVSRRSLGGFSVQDIEIVAAFDVSPDKIGKRLSEAIHSGMNNYPDIVSSLTGPDPVVLDGLRSSGSPDEVVAELKRSEAEVLLYSLPTGLQPEATSYALAAISAGCAVVNCTPERVARDPEVLAAASAANVPVVGDDLASHIGASVLHGNLLGLLAERGVMLKGSYQVNLGGNEDFRNLRVTCESKEKSKHNALRQRSGVMDDVTVIPSGGVVSHLGDRKVAHINLDGVGWAGMPVSIDVILKVQDSSNAAGVIVDLVRLAAHGLRSGSANSTLAAGSLLKSPVGIEDDSFDLTKSLAELRALSVE